MKIEFVSHAGFIVEVNGKKIFSDPWTRGKVFNESWALCAPAASVDYSLIHYIFVSHEHPDHLNFPTLKGIPAESRKQIFILYQKHASSRLSDTLKKMGFGGVIELPIYRWIELDKVEFYCGSAGSMDSFLAIRHNQITLLNFNDCVFNSKQYQYIRREIGNVDVLFTQFSFANFVGNEKDEYDSAGKKIEDILNQIEIFKPQYTIPFASFVYFCNQENSRMNEWSNTPQKIYDLNLDTVQFMYPSDHADLKNPIFKSSEAVEKYMNDLTTIKIDPTPLPTSYEDIHRAITENLGIFKSRIPYFFRLFVKPFSIYLHDLKRGITINPRTGVIQPEEQAKCRYVMCSQVAWFTFNHSWGTGTLEVSGMFTDLEITKPKSKYFFFQNLISTEFITFKSWGKSARTLQFLWRKKWEILYRFMG